MRQEIKIFIALWATLLLASTPFATAPGNVDARISLRLAKTLERHSEYANVHYSVEDAVVTLTGTVKLETSRRALQAVVEAIPEVAAVHNRVLLDPPPPPDDQLRARVLQRLQPMRLPELKINVHAGLVTLAGSVTSRHQRDAVTAIVAGTQGVREMESHIRVEGGE